MGSESNVYFDLRMLLGQDDLKVRQFASLEPSMPAAVYFEMLSKYLDLAPVASRSLHNFLRRAGDRDAYKSLDGMAALLGVLRMDKFVPEIYTILDAYDKGSWRVAATYAKQIIDEFDDLYERIKSARRVSRLQFPTEGEDPEGFSGPGNENEAALDGKILLKELILRLDNPESAEAAERPAVAERQVFTERPAVAERPVITERPVVAERQVFTERAVSQERAERTESAQYTESAESESKPLILAVDDSPVILKSVSSVLSGEYKVYTLVKPAEIEKVLRKLKPDLFLLDYQMPELNGFELIPIIRSHAEHKDTPIVFLTSEGSIDNVTTAIALGARDFIVKPFMPDTLRAKVARHIVQTK